MDILTYRIDQFEGPLDLLLTLIQKNKVNIEDIPISLICDQYLEYIKAQQDMDMEIAGEFIVMASELMLIKSRMLLPRVQEEEKTPVQNWLMPSCVISKPSRQPLKWQHCLPFTAVVWSRIPMKFRLTRPL